MENKKCSKCAICHKDIKIDARSTCVDHDHSTSKIRGILCRKCNLLLGHAEDNIEVLKSAITYLNKEVHHY